MRWNAVECRVQRPRGEDEVTQDGLNESEVNPKTQQLIEGRSPHGVMLAGDPSLTESTSPTALASPKVRSRLVRRAR
jgi:hypothetical protein